MGGRFSAHNLYFIFPNVLIFNEKLDKGGGERIGRDRAMGPATCPSSQFMEQAVTKQRLNLKEYSSSFRFVLKRVSWQLSVDSFVLPFSSL